MPTLQRKMQALSTPNFRYFTCLLDKGHIISWAGGCLFTKIQESEKNCLQNEEKTDIVGKGKYEQFVLEMQKRE